MGAILGSACKAYRNTGTYGAPVWNEVPNIKDLSVDISTAEADVSTRGNAGWRATVAAQNDATATWNMVYDTTDADFVAFKDAIINKTSIELLFLDGPVGTTGSQGLRARWMLTSTRLDQGLETAVMVDITARPTYNTDAAPAWYTVP